MHPRLTERDIAVLLDIYTYRYMTGTQIERLHFPSNQIMWRRMRSLIELGCVKSFTVPTIAERLFYLDKKGAEIVAIELDVEMEELGWHRHTRQPKDYYFMKHFLAINDFWFTLKEACQKNYMRLVRFIPEYHGEQTRDGYVKKLIRDSVDDLSHTPDAVFSLMKDDKPALFFLEIDRGNEVVSDPEKGLLKAVNFYLHYWPSSRWHQYKAFLGGDFQTFRTLFITTSKERIKHVREATSFLPCPDSHAKRFLWGTIQSQATPDWLFEEI